MSVLQRQPSVPKYVMIMSAPTLVAVMMDTHSTAMAAHVMVGQVNVRSNGAPPLGS